MTRPSVSSRPARFARLSALVCLLVSACASPQLRQASADCDPQAFQLFPLVMQSQRVTEPVVVQVPDGTQQCVTESVRQGDRSTAVTRCVPNYTMQTRWVDRWVQVDLNARERGIWHDRCVQQLCVQRLGNPKCEPPAAPAPPLAPVSPLPSVTPLPGSTPVPPTSP